MSDFNDFELFSIDFSKITKIPNFMKISPEEVESFSMQTEVQTDRKA
jgi:hypothetical protein